MKRYPLVIWDFDGTIADTFPLALETFNALAAERGFEPIRDPAAVRTMRTRDFLQQHRIPLWRLPLLIRAFLRKQRDRIATAPLFAGVAETLQTLQGSGVRQGILSSNGRENIELCLGHHDLLTPFAFIEGFARLFGKARGLKKLVKREQVATSAVLYVGDEVRDIEAAREAGIDCAAVTWGFHQEPLLTAARPTYLCQSPAALLALMGGK